MQPSSMLQDYRWLFPALCGLIIGSTLYKALSGCSASPYAALDVFPGKHYTKPGQTLNRRLVYSGPFARIEEHTVRIDDQGNTVSDWLWLDIKDQVNILVEDADGNFVVFEQTKYGLDGSSLAVVGGMIEPSDKSNQAAAIRELNEEMGQEAASWVFLGHYRTDVNRGGGSVSCFLARKCRRAAKRLASDDLESQKYVKLTKEELRHAMLSHRFKEIKWSGTVAMALAYLDSDANS
eukprot:TRINITY_DN5420_c1_g1_i1.p1 TRINITY_DN5420_c1_g1~~TRINITY_DN5420_c1_g1_i1.p1  ORF type:complete len:236 (+),score=21.77 TRINITY_DN5420_c1_g1_i1:170-877(+)